MTFFVPPTFTAIAFDSGGVASGPLTATFMLPFAMGACSAAGGNVMTDAFGLVALVAMTPLITIQLLGDKMHDFSFPSGHTGAAGVLLVLTVGCLMFESMREDEPGWLFLGYGFAAAVGFGRMLTGRHYLSDVCMAILIDSLLLLIALATFAILRKKNGTPPSPTGSEPA